MNDPETQLTTFAHGAKPSSEADRNQMRAYFEALMNRGPVSMVITAEFANGDAATSAVGSPAGVELLAKLGVVQVLDMLQRGNESGENG